MPGDELPGDRTPSTCSPVHVQESNMDCAQPAAQCAGTTRTSPGAHERREQRESERRERGGGTRHGSDKLRRSRTHRCMHRSAERHTLAPLALCAYGRGPRQCQRPPFHTAHSPRHVTSAPPYERAPSRPRLSHPSRSTTPYSPQSQRHSAQCTGEGAHTLGYVSAAGSRDRDPALHRSSMRAGTEMRPARPSPRWPTARTRRPYTLDVHTLQRGESQ